MTLTLKENIFLESIPNSLATTKEFQLKSYLEQKGNEPLTRLFNKIDQLDSLPSLANAETKKLTALLKGLIQDVDYLFFESPEKHLNTENLYLFISALKYHTIAQKKIVFISSLMERFWTRFCSKAITRNEDHEFLIFPLGKEQEGRGQLRFLNLKQLPKKQAA